MGCEILAYGDMTTELRKFDRRYHGSRIENAVGSGTPDVTQCIKGVEHWVEMKGMQKFRGKPSSVLHLPHELRDTQRKWLRNRWDAGGNCWVVLGVREPKEWLIWTGPVAAAYLGFETRERMINLAAVHVVGNFPSAAFYETIRERQSVISNLY